MAEKCELFSTEASYKTLCYRCKNTLQSQEGAIARKREDIVSVIINQFMPARFVTIKVAAAITGLSEKAIYRKIERGIWLEGRHFRRTDGRLFIDMKRYEEWVDRGM